MLVNRVVIVAVMHLNVFGNLYCADSSNYSKIQWLRDGASRLVAGAPIINCFDCKAYLSSACNYVTANIDARCQTIKNSLDEHGQYVLYDAPFFCHDQHDVQFDAVKYKGKTIPICSKCIDMLANYELENCDLIFTKLTDILSSNAGNMATTSHQGRGFGSVNQGMTPVWTDVLATITNSLQSSPTMNFAEVGSGYNLKPLALWLLGQGKINCTVSDINSDNSKDFIRSYLLLDPREIKASHKQSFITLDISSVLNGDLRKKVQRFDVLVLTNVLHYFNAEQVKQAMLELNEATKSGSIVYLQAFSGTDEHHTVNPLLETLVGAQAKDEPIYLASGQVYKFVTAKVAATTKKKMTTDELDDVLLGHSLLPSIATTTQNEFSFFPVASLKKLANDHGFDVLESGIFDITTPSAGTSGPLKTPYFSWVKIQKR
jgi:hypothetical protein